MANKTFKVTLVKSLIGRQISHKACAYGLGLRKMHQTAEIIDTSANRGMAKKINYMLSIEG